MIDLFTPAPLSPTEQLLKHLYQHRIDVRNIAFTPYFDELLAQFGIADAKEDPVLLSLLLPNDEDCRFFFAHGRPIEFSHFLRYRPVRMCRSDILIVMYVTSGHIEFITENTQTVYPKGSVIIMAPGAAHSVALNDDDSACFTLGVGRSALPGCLPSMLQKDNIISDFLGKCAFSLPNTEKLTLFVGLEDATLRDIFTHMAVENSETDGYAERILFSLFEWLILYLSRRYLSRYPVQSGSTGELFINILSFVANNYDTATLQSTADHFHVSKNYICRVMKKNSSLTFNQFVTDYRMKKGAALLESRSFPIDTVSSILGYSDVSSFYRIFKRYYSITPAEYRRRSFRAEEDFRQP